MRLILISFAVLASIFSPAMAENTEKQTVMPPKADYGVMKMTKAAPVRTIIDPLRLKLDNGRIVQLTGLDVPGFTPYDAGPYAADAVALLEEHIGTGQVRLYQSEDPGKRTNRMDYDLAHVETKQEDIWAQGLLLVNGLARVRPSRDHTEMAAQMLNLENRARENGAGMWGKDEETFILTPDTAAQALNNWGIVEGVIRATAAVRNRIYLNFGDDWRTDFTIVIEPAVRREMAQQGIDPLALAHKRVRVRGWVEDYNGPSIDLMAPVWLEILPESTDTPKMALPEHE